MAEKNKIWIAQVSQDAFGLVPQTLNLQNELANYGYEVHYVMVSGAHLTLARMQSVQLCYKQRFTAMPEAGLEKQKMKILFFDTDMYILNDPGEIAKIIKEADEKDLNICGNYKKGDNNWILDENIYKEEIINDNYIYIDPFKYAVPFGFLYCYIPYSYIFKMTNVGEDIYFTRENPEIKIYLDKRIKLGHLKRVLLK